MVNKELLDYITSESAKSVPLTVIKSNLLENDWSPRDIEEAETALGISSTKYTNPSTAAAQAAVENPLLAPQASPAQQDAFLAPTSQNPSAFPGLSHTQSSPYTLPAEPKKKKPSKGHGVAILLIFLVLFAVTAAYAYYAGYFTRWGIVLPF